MARIRRCCGCGTGWWLQLDSTPSHLHFHCVIQGSVDFSSVVGTCLFSGVRAGALSEENHLSSARPSSLVHGKQGKMCQRDEVQTFSPITTKVGAPFKNTVELYSCPTESFFFFFFFFNCHYRSSWCGTSETNLTSNHEVAGLIPSLIQWVKDLLLP